MASNLSFVRSSPVRLTHTLLPSRSLPKAGSQTNSLNFSDHPIATNRVFVELEAESGRLRQHHMTGLDFRRLFVQWE